MRNQITWKESLANLIEGNNRFRMGLRSVESFASTLRLREFAEKGQSPSAIILTCSDSRVPTELLFDKGVGDLFVIRVAGNVVSRSLIASIEYAAMVLQTPLCVVMGHTQCGAVRAALGSVRKEMLPSTPHIEGLLEKISPSVKLAMSNVSHKDDESILQASIITNVQRQVRLIEKNSQSLRALVRDGKFQIVGALYNLHDGEVRFDVEDLKSIEPLQPIPEPTLNRLSFTTK